MTTTHILILIAVALLGFKILRGMVGFVFKLVVLGALVYGVMLYQKGG